MSRGVIQAHLRLSDGLSERGVADRAGFKQIDRHPEEPVQIFYEAKVTVGMWRGEHRVELDEHIQVARARVAVLACGGAEQGQAADAESSSVTGRERVIDGAPRCPSDAPLLFTCTEKMLRY